ncbi:MAG: 1-(5-phosphoribosyl)-5-[(5-phosphoribosylamino)methylideneamino]imidazole-4-carboxamide isomerase [Prochlorotrichaceae cyanobacterium]|jgi:phosphoribosylformimino-5-aminoimidazole carboxamide ribotide isomerase
MDVIPAIDLLEGRCVRLYQGDYAQAEVFSDNPLAMAKQWASQGADRLHVVDLDGAKSGSPTNHGVLQEICAALTIPVQVGGGIRNRQTVESLLGVGVSQVILGTAAVENPQLVAELCQAFPGQIVVGIDARNGQVATKGWLETTTVQAVTLAQRMADLGVAGIIYTDIDRDGTLQGPNINALRDLVSQVSIPVIASGGVSSITDLLRLLTLEAMGVTGAIVGKALYSGALSLEEALQSVGQGRWQDVPADLGSTSIA